ncbi:MAG: hypothetical protein M3178_06920 [Pseudomonadota bacterium]|nr:hypothetical protein [Pseudomonadota bacterium]
MSANGKAGFSINEWCFDAEFSPALYYERQKKGLGPRVAHVGRRTIVTEPAPEYLKRLELESCFRALHCGGRVTNGIKRRRPGHGGADKPSEVFCLATEHPPIAPKNGPGAR